MATFLRRCNPDAVLLMYIGWVYNRHPMVTFAATLSKALVPRARFVTQFANVTGAKIADFGIALRLFHRAIKMQLGETRRS